MSEATTTVAPSNRAMVGIGAGLVLLAAVVWVDSLRLPVSQTVGVGPAAAMYLISVLLALVGIAHWVAAWRNKAPGLTTTTVAVPVASNSNARFWVMGGLLGMIAVLQFGGGFIVSAAWLFAATARAFGQPIRLKSPILGLILSGLVYVFFSKALGLSLPAGPLEKLLLG